jgi:hypothetical protein
MALRHRATHANPAISRAGGSATPPACGSAVRRQTARPGDTSS